MLVKERYLEDALQFLEAANRIANAGKLDWHSLQTITVQLTQSLAAFNMLRGAIDQKEENNAN